VTRRSRASGAKPAKGFLKRAANSSRKCWASSGTSSEALAQRRDRQRHDVEAIVEVPAEGPRARGRGDVEVRGGDEGHVDRHVVRAAEAPDGALLQDAQELRLHTGSSSPISSRNRVPPEALSTRPARRSRASV
jgi:hypothetical protein